MTRSRLRQGLTELGAWAAILIPIATAQLGSALWLEHRLKLEMHHMEEHLEHRLRLAMHRTEERLVERTDAVAKRVENADADRKEERERTRELDRRISRLEGKMD